MIFEYYKKVISNYVTFTGRAQRAEYWYFTLVNVLVAVVLSIVSSIFTDSQIVITAISVISIAYSLFVLLPGIAVTVRRLHDTGRSGWMILISLIPIIGGIWLLVLMLLDSEEGENQYGSNPKNDGRGDGSISQR